MSLSSQVAQLPALAFKIASRAASLDSPAGAFFSRSISTVTGSPFSHVELWFDGDRSTARCFSSREPSGTSWATINLSDPSLWTIVQLPFLTPVAKERLEWFLNGSVGRHYDAAGIVGIATDTSVHDQSDRFCSEMQVDWMQGVMGWLQGVARWHVAPGWTKGGDRFGLFELVTQGKLTA